MTTYQDLENGDWGLVKKNKIPKTEDYHVLPDLITNQQLIIENMPKDIEFRLGYGTTVDYIDWIGGEWKATLDSYPFNSFYVTFIDRNNILPARYFYQTGLTELPSSLEFPNLSYDLDSYVWNNHKIITSGQYDAFRVSFYSYDFYPEEHLSWEYWGGATSEIDLNLLINFPDELTLKYSGLNDLIHSLGLETLQLYEYESLNGYQGYLNFFLNPNESRDINDVSKTNVSCHSW